jgi:hypothetical protein
MPKTDEAVRLSISVLAHVLTVLEGWAAADLQATPEEVLEALADARCTNEDLRPYAADLLAHDGRT